MAFDPKLKELARAHDAVDRLKDVEARIQQDEEDRAKLHDAIVRGAILGLLAVVIIIAVYKL